MRKLKVQLNHTTFRIVAVLISALTVTGAVLAYGKFEIQPGAALAQTNAAAVIRVTAVGRDDLYDTASQGNLDFHVKVRGSCDNGWRVGSATVTIKGKVHHLTVNKSIAYIGFDEGQKWNFQVATFPYLPPDTQSPPVAMCNAELARRLARGDSKSDVLSQGFDLTVPHAYDAELSVACLRTKNGFLDSEHPRSYTKLPVTISCQPTDYKPEPTPGGSKSTPGAPKSTPGTPQRTPGTPQRTPGAPQRTPSLPGRLSFPNPQLEFVDQQRYDVNGERGTRYKLRVTNRASLPDFLWQPAAKLPPCGKNQNSSRTWVEVFGSPGDERLAGVCSLGSSEDLAQLWFAVPAGEKGPPCVYIVMTDRETGKKYVSNRVCSRLFSLVTGTMKGGGQTKDIQKGKEKWIEIQGWDNNNQSPATVQGSTGKDQISSFGSGNAPQQSDSGAAAEKKTASAQSDLSIRQFLFPPTNDKALRVRVTNTGQGPSAACRLVLTVRKINGAAVGRTTYVNVPALAAGAAEWLLIDARNILPNTVSLQSTTFRLNVDATELVAELNESNNEVGHDQ